jgi:Arc/MetJ-type ribon-helix-helix transcriptional regulator
MTIELKPGDEELIQKRLRSGGFASAEEVIHHALQVQDAEAAELETHRRETGAKIERAIAEFDQGGGVPASGVRDRLEEMKAAQTNRGRCPS